MVNEKTQYIPYPDPKSIEHLMTLWMNEFQDISRHDLSLEKAIRNYTRSHLGFSSIHPFFDGNGRLARLLANIPMLKNGYLPLIISNENRADYINLLSQYNLNSNILDKNSKVIIEENEYFKRLYEFFTTEYKNSQAILDEIKR